MTPGLLRLPAPSLHLQRRVLTPAEAASVATWRYPPPYDVYDSRPDLADLLRHRGPGGEGYYPAVEGYQPAVETGRGRPEPVVAFGVLGAEARVHGQQEEPGVLDVGAGVRPDRTSRSLGTALVPQLVDLAVELFAPDVLRVAVASFNARSLALCRRAGFAAERELAGPGGRPFTELVRPLR